MDLDTLWDFGRPQVSEARFRDALADATGEDAQVLRTQLARALGLQGRFDEAHEQLAQVVPSTPSVGVYLELERGRLARSARDGDPRPHFEAALARATAAGIDHLAVDAAHMLAITGDGAEQIPAAQRALEIARASDDHRARRWVASVTHNLGWTMHELGRHDEALALWEEALRARRERYEREGESQAEPLRVARWTVARGLRELGRRDEALAIQRALRAQGPPDEYVDQELAALGDDGEEAQGGLDGG
jgi:tetratricopeptide (TPR) repeat protein